MRANDFDDGQHFFAGWSITNGGDVLYADKATYPFAQDLHLYAVWRSPGDPLDIVAKLTGPTTASVTFQAAPKADGTPAATKSYEVAADQGGVGITGTTTVTGPGTYSFDVVPGRRYVFRMGIYNSGIYYNSNEIAVPLPANLKVVRFYATESPTPGVAGTMAPQYASTATALKRNAFTQTDLSFVGWRDDNLKYYENEATYAFDKDVNLIGVWRSPGTPFNIVAKLTALTSASVTFQAAPNLDGTPAAVRSYDVSLIRKGVKVGVRKVTGPGTYDFAVQRDYPYQFIVEDQVSNEIVVTPSAMVNTITFNPNGGSGSLASQSASTATALTQNADAIKRSGYAFDGWATTPTGSMAYADGKSYPFTASATLYARWVAVVPVLTVTFNPNGGSGSLASQSASTAAALTLNADAIKRSGYAFDGWATTPTGSMAYADGKSYPFTASATLYARWLPTKTVTFSANLGTGTMANQASHVATALTANGFKRKAYVFDGWATTATGKQAYPNGGSYPFTSDSMLYARWVCKPFAVTVNGAYGLGTTKASVNFETTSELPMTTVTAKTTTGGYSATITTPAISGVIYVKDLVKNTAYKFKVTATNTAGCSSTNPGEAPFRK